MKKIKEYEELCGKMDKKLEKIKKSCIDFNYEFVQTEDVMRTKQALIQLEKNIDK